MPLPALLPSHHLLLAFAISSAVTAAAFLLRLPSRFLHGLHTYIHPDSLPAGSAPRAALRPPSSSSDPRRKPKPQNNFDESAAQLFRLRLVDSHLHSRLLFPLYRLSFLAAAFSLPLLASDAPAAAPAAAAAAALLLLSLVKAAAEPSASKRSESQLSVLSAVTFFVIAVLIIFSLSPSVFDFRFTTAAAVTAVASGCLAGLLFLPAARSARSFWLGTDQLRWNLSVVSCGAVSRFLLYASILLNFFAPVLWIKPVTAAVPEWGGEVVEYRVWVLLAAAAVEMLVVRANLQMYLNEAVLCWYQRLHSSRAPDLDYGRAKVFLHNHYLCLALVQFFAPPVLVMLMVGVSQLRGDLFSGVVVVDWLEDYSTPLKEMALFLAWWIMFVRAILTMASLAIYRCGFLFVS